VRADPEQLHRVLSNLVRNARQAIAASGKPGEIRVGHCEMAPKAWKIDGQRHRTRPAAKGARSPVPAVPWRGAQGWQRGLALRSAPNWCAAMAVGWSLRKARERERAFEVILPAWAGG
jgi:hypothetical protein